MKRINKNTFLEIKDAVLLRALNALSRAINTLETYGENHPAFRQIFETCYAEMQQFFLKRKKVYIGAFNGIMTIDEKPVHVHGTLMKSLEKRLSNLEITSLRISSGISELEFRQLVKLLSCKEAEDFKKGIKATGLPHVINEKAAYQAVRKGQTVAYKGELSGGPGVLVIEDEDETTGSTESDGSASLHIDQIVAFLKGEIDVEEQGVQEDLRKLVSDPDKLGQLIMEAVAVRQTVSELSGESLSDIILGCLRRTYEGLKKDPQFKGIQGRTNIKKALLLLEKNILEKMRNVAGPNQPELDRKILQAIREMEEDLELEILAAKYIEHREAIERSEKKIASYIRSRGIMDAQEILSGTNLPPKDWQRIVVQSLRRTGNGKDGGPFLSNAHFGTLAVVLEKLEKLMRSDQTDSNTLKQLVNEANLNVNDIAESARNRIDQLARRMEGADKDSGTIGSHTDGMSRRELLAEIAEIAQELMQPITAINTTIEMILCGYAGELTPDQKDLIILASGSADHLRNLMDELITIVGFPTNLGTNERYTRHRNKQILK